MPNKAIVSKVKKVSIEEASKETYKKTFLHKILEIKSKSIYKRIKQQIKGTKILDIGTGIGGIAALFKLKGYEIESIDIDNSSYFQEFPSTIYDGINFPYKDNTFDTALIIHVLHHCSDRMTVLREAMRTSKRVIVIEDTYRNKLEWGVVSINDMLGNGEFYFHEYSTTEEWKNIIKKEGWKIIHVEEYSEFIYNLLYGRYVLFVIEKE